MTAKRHKHQWTVSCRCGSWLPLAGDGPERTPDPATAYRMAAKLLDEGHITARWLLTEADRLDAEGADAAALAWPKGS